MNNLFLDQAFKKIVCVAHALTIVAIWLAHFKLNIEVINAKTWFLLALLWYPWVIFAILKHGKEREYWIYMLGVCLLFLLPTLSTQYAFASWALEGFAP
jgi:hypothetical protein